MKLKSAARRPHELAKLSRLCGGFVHLRCRNPPEPVRFDIERRGSAALETPGAKNPRHRAPGKGVQKFLVFLNDGNEVTNYYMFHVLFDFSKNF